MIYRVIVTTGYVDTFFDFHGSPTDAVQFMKYAYTAYNAEKSDEDRFELFMTLIQEKDDDF